MARYGSGLRTFSANLRGTRRKYEIFVADGVSQGRRAELQGGGLVRSSGGWRAVQELRVEGKGMGKTNGFSVGVHL